MDSSRVVGGVLASGNRGLVIFSLLFSVFMSAMEATVVATAMPTVVAELHGLDLYGWVGTVYMLSSTVTMPLWGKLADLRGRKPMLLAGMAFFLLGSVLSGLSQTMVQLVIFRAVQGIGAGALQPLPMTIIGDLYTIQERGKAQGLFGAVWGISGMSGPLLGGLIVHALSWRWVFFVNIPFGIISAVMLWMFFKENRSLTDKPLQFDFTGAMTLSVAILSVLLGVNGNLPWLMLPLSLVSLVAFLYTETRAKEPIVPLQLFQNRAIAVASVSAVLMGIVMNTTFMFVPLYVQAVLSGSPTQAGATVSPMLVGWPIAAAVSGRILPRVGARPLIRIGLGLVLVGTVGQYLVLRYGISLHALRVTMAVFGAGMGFSNTAIIVSVQESVGWSQRAMATATSMFFRSIGGAIALGALGSLLARNLSGVMTESQINALVTASRRHDAHTTVAVSSQLTEALASGMMPLFVITAIAGAFAAISAWFFPAVKFSNQVK